MQSEMEREQAFVDRAYERLEATLRFAVSATAGAAATAGRSFDHRVVRDALVDTGSRRVAALDFGDEALVFGRLDAIAGDAMYVGRVGVADENRDRLVVDWRAPVAEPFYRATPADSRGVARRRHLLCRGRRVVGIEDELLEPGRHLALVGEGALLASLRRARSGRMRDIVATIQSEQDEIVRAPLEGALLVRGGPGTGKTVVALHRVAYLLYTHRRHLERDGVLVVGPSAIFLRYIEQVIPSLGEQAAMLTTMAGLAFSGDPAPEDPAVERVKGDARMAEVVARAVALRQRRLREPLRVLHDGELVVLHAERTAAMIEAAREAGGTHNSRRRLVTRLLMAELYALWQREVEASVRAGDRGARIELDEDGAAADFTRAMLDDPRVRGALDDMWPALEPDVLVDELLADPSAAADGLLDDDEIGLLSRPKGSQWTEGDAALLDEASVILGPRRRPEARESGLADEELYFVERLLEDVRAIGDYDAHLRVDAVMLRDIGDRIVQERFALEDDATRRQARQTFGYVVVDEAQDLSPMQWRMIARRCPSGSMTILGDLGQASRAWAPRDWAEVTAQLPVAARSVELSVNYRTPAEIMRVAHAVLNTIDPAARLPRTVRRGEAPAVRRASRSRLARTAVAEANDSLGDGRAAIIAASGLLAEVRALLGLGSATWEELLDARVTALGVREAKGLEFDAVVVVEPARIDRRGLYIALTRATQRVAIVYAEDLPAPLMLGKW